MNDLHHSCEPWAEPISLAAAGCLTPEEDRDVLRHIETCSDCRERFRQLTDLCGTLVEAQLPVDCVETIVQRAMTAVASDESRRPVDQTEAEMIQSRQVSRSLDNWRCIMRSPVFRVSTAAVFALAVTSIALFFQGGGGTAFALDDFAAPILEAKTVKYKMTVEMKGPPVQTITSEIMMLDGARIRQVTELPDKSKGVIIRDLSQGKELFLMAATKTATVFTSKTLEYRDPLAGFRMLVAQDKPGIEREPLGEKVIDGRKVVGFHISSPGGDFSLWGDPKTGLPVRVEMTMGIEGSQKITFSDFVFDVDMDESLFSIEPPAGYTVKYQKSKSDGSPLAEKNLIEMFREYSKLCGGAFPDSLDHQTTKLIVFRKGDAQLKLQSLWESARLKGNPNEEQRHKFEEVMLKLTPEMNEEQIKKIGEQIGEQLQEFTKTQGQKTEEVGEVQSQETQEVRQAQFREVQHRVDRGLQFANRLGPNTDAHYVGKGVSFGAADTPIFWYRPKDSKNYRVIYADLSVRDSVTPPNVTKGQPVPAPQGPKE